MTWTALCGAALSGGMLRGLTGFGAALLMAPLLSLVVPARETMCLVTLLSALPVGQALSPGLGRLVDRRLLAPMIVAACAGVPGGIWLVGALPEQLFGMVIGVAVIVSACALLTGVTLGDHRSLGVSLGVGALSGVLTGFGGVGGPPAILYVLGVESDTHRARANFIVFFAFLYPFALAAIALVGMLSWAVLARGILLLPLFHLGGVLGERLYQRVRHRHFRPLVLALLIVTGAVASVPRHALAGVAPATLMVRGAPVQCASTSGAVPAGPVDRANTPWNGALAADPAIGPALASALLNRTRRNK
jgi:uncharacterized membrane protein YfcA